jgi:hypothetical protein
MRVHIDPVIASRIKTAWAALPPERRNRIAPLLQRAHQRALVATRDQIAPKADPSLGTPATLAMSALTGDSEGIVQDLDWGIVVSVDGSGEIWGTGKYEGLDPGWLEALAEWLEHLLLAKHPFNTAPQTIQIPDTVQIALAGDWGTGEWRSVANPAPGTRVAKQITLLHPHFSIHLGDVYYSGTEDEEEHILMKDWPEGILGTFALNSNHEMYSGGDPYFEAIATPKFRLQQGCSYFALENQNWIIVGLDSAYFSDEDTLYRDGALFAGQNGIGQLTFLKQQAEKGKKVILLTHHNPLSEDGSAQGNLWSQAMSAFPDGSAPAYWYWGHAHLAAVYAPQKKGTATVLCRCSGHGGLPIGAPSNLQNNPKVIWYEDRKAGDPDVAERILNGFVCLSLDGPSMKEVFYDETGGIAWPAPSGGTRSYGLLRAPRRTPSAAKRLSEEVGDSRTSRVQVNVFDGTRQPIGSGTKALVTIVDGNKKQLIRDSFASGTIFDVPFYDNAGDDYSVIAYADGYSQAGFFPVKCSPGFVQTVDLMLLRKNAGFRFAGAQWGLLQQKRPLLYSILTHGAPTPGAAADRYNQLMEERPESLACLLNIATAMEAIVLPVGNSLQYFKELIWDKSMAQDRFYGYADPVLYDQVRSAASQRLFEREEGFAIFHSGATDSYKQVQFGEANVQLTFHANDTKVIDGVTCMKMEPDIDYYQDPAAHALLEVISHGISGSLTDPRQVYVLRWIAGRRAGIGEFDPLYVID